MTTLFGLPIELTMFILAEVRPLDLIRMSRVCKVASGILADRSVWEGVVRRIQRENSLFEPTFEPLDSLDLDHLKKAALRPELFHAKLSMAPQRSCRTRERTLEIKVDGELDFTRVQMVPGGRYVVGLSYAEICIWDVGSPGSTPEPILLDIAHVRDRLSLTSLSAPSQTSHGSFIFAVYADEGSSQGGWQIQVYEVAPLRDNERLRNLGSFRLDCNASQLLRFWISGDRLYVHRSNSLLTIWDFVNRSVASWYLPGTQNQGCNVLNMDDMVILLEPNDLYAWKVPPLEPFGKPSSTLVNNIVVNPPFTHAPYHNGVGARPLHIQETKLFLPSKWTIFSPNTPVIFHILHRIPGSVVKGEFRRLRLEVSDDKKSIQATILSDGGSAYMGSFSDRTGLQPYSTCENRLFLIGRSPEFDIHHSPLDAGTNANWETVGCKAEHQVITVSMMCPFSGRFAYVCNNMHNSEFNRVHVVDLLDL